MKMHLTTEEIIDFVSMEKFNIESLELAGRVNSHIVECSECFHLVKAFQLIHGEFELCEKASDFKTFVSNRYNDNLQDEQFADL